PPPAPAPANPKNNPSSIDPAMTFARAPRNATDKTTRDTSREKDGRESFLFATTSDSSPLNYSEPRFGFIHAGFA
ncbi:MAG: hypothetical protein ACPGYV_10755, partial [Phycisphaeraceae bacterium]